MAHTKQKGARGVLTAAIQTTPPTVTWISVLSLFVLLVKILWLNNIPTKFTYATELGLLVDNICAATVAAYLFFVISIQVPQVMEQRRLGPTIVRLTSDVSDSMVFLLRMARNAAARELASSKLVLGEITQESVKEWFGRLSPLAKSPPG